ncbi:MAG: VWA domain-containing protein [Clostridiales bacterium]|nr:VWA domain-containing protein [Clostridiales bacterium]
MEMTYPIALYIGAGIAAAAIIVLLFFMKGKKYSDGLRSANNEYVKKLPQYKMLVLEYHSLKVLAIAGLVGMILSATCLIAKPIKVHSDTEEIHNRDIIIGFDVSTSLDSVSVEMCEQVQDLVDDLKGERFGIVIFNGQAVRLVPLTDDYSYVLSELEHLKRSIEAGQNIMFYSELDELSAYRFAGTSSDRGSSLIGDGLASCLYSFTGFDEDPDRARLIIFVTDNDVMGDEIVTLEQAGVLCQYKGVKVFGLAPYFVTDESEFRGIMESTGGKYYNTRSNDAIEELVDDVKDTDVSVTYKTHTTIEDQPEAFIIILMVSSVLFGFAVWRLKL